MSNQSPISSDSCKMEVSAEQVEQAVVEFYRDPVAKGGLNTWLMQAQHSRHSWTFAWPLLDQRKVMYNAASYTSETCTSLYKVSSLTPFLLLLFIS